MPPEIGTSYYSVARSSASRASPVRLERVSSPLECFKWSFGFFCVSAAISTRVISNIRGVREILAADLERCNRTVGHAVFL